jgi:hypothetical protein
MGELGVKEYCIMKEIQNTDKEQINRLTDLLVEKENKIKCLVELKVDLTTALNESYNTIRYLQQELDLLKTTLDLLK